MPSQVGSVNYVLDGCTHWLNLVNTIDLSVCASDAALHQIISTTCYYYILREP